MGYCLPGSPANRGLQAAFIERQGVIEIADFIERMVDINAPVDAFMAQ